MKNKTASILSLLALFAGASTLNAEAKTFDFKDPKGVNNVAFTLDAPLESISGSARDITGTVSFDPEAAELIKGTITVAANSLTVTNSTMQEHLHSDGWLDVEAYPEISFSSKKLQNITEEANGITGDLDGEITIKGVTKAITVPVRLTYLPGKLSARTNGAVEGDLLVIRAAFRINRSEFGIKPGQATDSVAEEIEIRLSIAGAAPDA